MRMGLGALGEMGAVCLEKWQEAGPRGMCLETSSLSRPHLGLTLPPAWLMCDKS